MKRLLLLSIFILCACRLSQAAVETAVPVEAEQVSAAEIEVIARQTSLAQTVTALAVPTSTPFFTATPTETLVPTPTPTETLVPTPTPTLTSTPDLRIVDTDPQLLLCTMGDMPEAGLYYVPNSEWMSISTNQEVISIRTVEKGRAYINETGRVVGWRVDRKRGTRAAQLPDELGCGVYLFKTAEGARLAMTKYNMVETRWGNKDWKYLERELAFEEPYIIEIFQQMDSGGNRNTDITVELVYRNLLVVVEGYAPVEADVPLAVLEELVLKMLERIKEAPLVEPGQAAIAR